MDLATFQLLLTPPGQAALDEAMTLRPTEANYLACYGRLIRHVSSNLARAALDIALLRARAHSKFTHADQMYFTREALEQSSGEVVSHYRAHRFEGIGTIGDFCCGIGGDTLALARCGAVVAIDLDPLRLAMARENLTVHELIAQVSLVEADVLTVALPRVNALFLDPDRRAGGQRRLSLKEYRPSVDALLSRVSPDLPVAIKVAPGVPWPELNGYQAEAEFVSVHGELKECLLWFGPFRSVNRRATVLPGPHTLASDSPTAPAPPRAPLTYLYDPDPAIVRSGLVTNLGEQLNARQLDSTIAYLTSETLHLTPFAQCYQLEEAHPFHLRRLRERLRNLDVGHITVLKRGSAIDTGDLQKLLKLKGKQHRVVILTRVEGQPYALVGRSIGSAPEK